MNFFKQVIGKRRQFFEIQDFSWCPASLRNGITDYLCFSLSLVPLYNSILPWLSKMKIKNPEGWVDLCAGAGGGSLLLHKHMSDIPLVLTDLYPQEKKVSCKTVSFYSHSVDARNVPSHLKGFRTLFTSLHHLPDDVAQSVLQDAYTKRQSIGAFEFTERNLFCILMTAPTLLFSFILTPFILPWKFSRFFWTYLIPVLPFVTTFDILASCVRTRSVSELKCLVNTMNDKNYRWHIGQESSLFGFSITYIVGLPEDNHE